MSLFKKYNIKPRTIRVAFITLLIIVLFMEYIEDNDETYCSQEKINTVVKGIIKNNEKKTHHKLARACKSGMLRGCVTGGINGGLDGMIAGGVMYGLANPIIIYLSNR